MLNDNWIILESEDQLLEAEKASYDRPVVLFKHSTTCGISAAAEHRLHTEWNNLNGDFLLYHLDLLKHRPLSNLMAEKYGVVHQSPQVIILKNGEVVADTSHHMIAVEYLNKAI